jgi:hypothetical protein
MKSYVRGRNFRPKHWTQTIIGIWVVYLEPKLYDNILLPKLQTAVPIYLRVSNLDLIQEEELASVRQ